MSGYMDSAQNARVVVNTLLQERGLQPPTRWLLSERNGFVWLIGVLPVLPKLTPYVEQDVFHSLSTALQGKPVILSNSTGMRYAVLLSAKPKLPDTGFFQAERLARDIFPFGIGLKGNVEAHAKDWLNMIVGGSQGSGKSTFLRLVAHTARLHGWQLYLADPDGNTFPEIWNQAARRPVAGSMDEVIKLLSAVEAEIERRSALYAALAAKTNGMPPQDIEQYNQAAGTMLPRAVVVIDEANSYLGNKTAAESLGEIARRGRKWGIHVVLAAHNWRARDVSRALSSMFPTRVCLRVADDTSGEVVLDSHRWGMYALGITKPGRAAVKLSGKIQPVQTYLLGKEQEMAWLGSQPMSDPLSKAEREMVRCAIEEMGGEFPVGRLADRLKDTVSEWDVRKTAERWELRGWLTTPDDAVSARKVTIELAKMAGISS